MDLIMLRDIINDALKTAMKSQDKVKLSTLRLVNAAIKDRDIANRGEGKAPVDDSAIGAILTRMIKQREDSSTIYAKAGRHELAQSERDEIAIIRAFLPRQILGEEFEAIIVSTIKEAGAAHPRDMGQVMALLKQRFAGQIDFAKASTMVKAKLQNP